MLFFQNNLHRRQTIYLAKCLTKTNAKQTIKLPMALNARPKLSLLFIRKCEIAPVTEINKADMRTVFPILKFCCFSGSSTKSLDSELLEELTFPSDNLIK